MRSTYNQMVTRFFLSPAETNKLQLQLDLYDLLIDLHNNFTVVYNNHAQYLQDIMPAREYRNIGLLFEVLCGLFSGLEATILSGTKHPQAIELTNVLETLGVDCSWCDVFLVHEESKKFVFIQCKFTFLISPRQYCNGKCFKLKLVKCQWFPSTM